ncbi:MAG: hypothetical protein DRH26_01345 [Deltaproteobacteria bacterium]|nr:MAG: hypothetical protein DRH26_01345 [Deltaproteobacteria bacterium]
MTQDEIQVRMDLIKERIEDVKEAERVMIMRRVIDYQNKRVAMGMKPLDIWDIYNLLKHDPKSGHKRIKQKNQLIKFLYGDKKNGEKKTD